MDYAPHCEHRCQAPHTIPFQRVTDKNYDGPLTVNQLGSSNLQNSLQKEDK